MIEKILNDHYNFIKKIENLMRTEYNIDKNERILSLRGSNFQNKGEIHGYNYQFHGKGCRLEKEGVICDYNYHKKAIVFTLWGLKQFITSCNHYRNENFSDDYLELELYKLIENGKLLWLIDGGVVWEVYQYSDFW